MSARTRASARKFNFHRLQCAALIPSYAGPDQVPSFWQGIPPKQNRINLDSALTYTMPLSAARRGFDLIVEGKAGKPILVLN